MNKIKQYQKYIYVFLIVLFFAFYLGHSLINGQVAKPNNPYEGKDISISKVTLGKGLGIKKTEKLDKDKIEIKEDLKPSESKLNEAELKSENIDEEKLIPKEPGFDSEGNDEDELDQEKSKEPESNFENTEEVESDQKESKRPKSDIEDTEEEKTDQKKSKRPKSDIEDTEEEEMDQKESKEPESNFENTEEVESNQKESKKPESDTENTEEDEMDQEESEEPESDTENTEEGETDQEESEESESDTENTEEDETDQEKSEEPESDTEEEESDQGESEEPESDTEDTEEETDQEEPEVPEDNTIGTASIRIGAETLGKGTFASNSAIDIKENDNGANLLHRFFKQKSISYDNSGSIESSFYLERIYLVGINENVNISEELLASLEEENLTVDYDVNDANSLGEFDYTMNSGWVYSVNGHHMGYGFSDYVVEDGDEINIRFILNY